MHDVLYINVHLMATSRHIYYDELDSIFAFVLRWMTTKRHWKPFLPPTL